MIEDLIKAYGEYLDSLNIHVLRNVARRVGVYKPTDGKKENLIERTIAVLIGAAQPAPPSNRGAPLKDDALDPKYMRRLEQIREEYALRGGALSYENTTAVRSGEKSPSGYDRPLRMGILELQPNGSGFLRGENCRPSAEKDAFVPAKSVREAGLREGDYVVAAVSMREENDLPVSTEILSVNERSDYRTRGRFEDFAAAYPEKKIELSAGSARLSLRCADLFAPVGRGQRALVLVPPSADGGIFLRRIAAAVRSHADRGENLHLLTLFVDGRPEEAEEYKRCLSAGALMPSADFAYTTFDMDAREHLRAARLIFARAARLAETGEDAVVLLDSLTRLTYAADALCDGGKTLPCGLNVSAFRQPKAFFSEARKLSGGGSVTVIASLDCDTGDAAAEAVRSEFEQFANCRIFLCGTDAKGESRIDLRKSGTLRAETLLTAEEAACVRLLRSRLSDDGGDICRAMAETPDNAAFVAAVHADGREQTTTDEK